MLKFKVFSRTALAIMGLLACPQAFGSVSLTLTRTSDGSVLFNGSAGTTFDATVKLISTSTATADKSTGVDYYLEVSGPAGGNFTIQARDSTVGVYTDTYTSDGTIASNGEVLNPVTNARSDEDLGASINNVNTPVSNGTFPVAKFTILINPGTPAGDYTFDTFSFPGAGNVGPGPSFAGSDFASQGLLTLHVPEPSSALLLGACMIGWGVRRRR